MFLHSSSRKHMKTQCFSCICTLLFGLPVIWPEPHLAALRPLAQPFSSGVSGSSVFVAIPLRTSVEQISGFGFRGQSSANDSSTNPNGSDVFLVAGISQTKFYRGEEAAQTYPCFSQKFAPGPQPSETISCEPCLSSGDRQVQTKEN